MTTHSTQHGQSTMVWEEHGSGTPVLLLHSGGLSGRQWRKLAEELSSTGYRVVVPDLLGYGSSSAWPSGRPFHFREDVAALERVIEGVESLHLVGHSYGGVLALQLALANPARVRSMQLFEPVASGLLDRSDMGELGTVRMEWIPDTPDGADEDWLRQFVEWWNGRGAWDALTPDVKEAFRRSGWKVFQEVIALIGDQTPASSYGVISAPVLLMGAGRSPATERRILERLAQALPSASLHIFEGLGHMAPVSHAKIVNPFIIEHIRAAG